MNALALGVALSFAAPTPPSTPAPRDAAHADDFDDLMAKAEAARSHGETSAALRLHVRAHRSLDPQARVGLMGEIAMDNALDDLDGSHTPAEDGAALAPWLADAIEERDAAHTRGEATPAPQRWHETLQRITPPPATPATPPPRPAVDPTPSPTPDPAPTTHKRDRALLATGITTTLAGLSLIGGGLAIHGRVRRTDTDPIWPSPAAAMSPEATAYTREADAWQARGRRIGTGLAVGGAVLAASGIALTTWTAIRLHRTRMEVAVVPWTTGQGSGLLVRLRPGGRR